ncbi:hypothetical protein GCM10009850_046240 [Nonomuraea monospora]|uniref:Secreted protein n=1 Tax=Nonomuraea monospora TaxID=568818 RepID=A0ABN3CIB8_9ACTN
MVIRARIDHVARFMICVLLPVPRSRTDPQKLPLTRGNKPSSGWVTGGHGGRNRLPCNPSREDKYLHLPPPRLRTVDVCRNG